MPPSVAAIRVGGALGSTSASTAEGSRFESGPTLQRRLSSVAPFLSVDKPQPVKAAPKGPGAIPVGHSSHERRKQYADAGP